LRFLRSFKVNSFPSFGVPDTLPLLKPKQPSTPSPRRRKWWFRVIAIAVPLVNLVLLELILRAFGCGYPTSFFLKSRVNGRDVFIENQHFSRRYFPPGLERAPQPLMFSTVKAPDTVRIFIFGESAAMGDPEPAFGFPRVLEVLLREALPGKKIEVINVAATAINSHVVGEIAKDCADKQGDYWIVYMGNNEVVGPFGAGTVFGDQTPPLAIIRANTALKSIRLGQMLDALKWKLTRKAGTPQTWEGMEMFLKQQVPLDHPRLARAYSYFERNLRGVVQLGHRSGARVLVSTMVSNLKDCPPFESAHRRDLTEAQRAAWQRAYDSGLTQLRATNYGAAIEQFIEAGKIDERYAELQFALGRCLLEVGRTNEVRTCFELARELDTLRFRADARINGVIRQVTGSEPGVQLVDAVGHFTQRSSGGLIGDEFLYEHVHFKFEGNYELARLFAKQIVGGQTNERVWLSREECARRLAFTDFNRFQVLDEVRQRLQQPPFTFQLGHEERDRRLKEQLDRLQPAVLDTALHVYEEAIALRPEDWELRENFAKLLQDFGRTRPAEEQWRQVLSLMPHNEQAYYGLANTLDAQGKSAEAVAYFKRALQRRPGSIEARNGLALALANQGRVSEAIDEYQRALRQKPDFVEARVNLGQTLAQQGKLDEALAQYIEALRLNSNNVAAHINLGKLLAGRGKHAEAALHYRQAIGLKPDNAVAHFNLGNALSALGDAGATTQFAEAVRCKPDFAEARYNLGLALAKEGRSSEALTQLAEVVRLEPNFAEGRFNYGVALAKARRFDEATEQFRETLRLDPQNERAKKFLEQAEALKGR
jgi:tetratricopeptide (TPR) repeat protein